MTIPVAHDFTCPWCWIAYFQVRDLKREFRDLQFDWIGYELYPETIPWPEPGPALPAVASLRPKTPTRLELAYAAQGIERPTVIRPKQMRIHNAHEAVEFAKGEGVAGDLVDVLYRAYWEEGREIGNVAVLSELAQGIITDRTDFRRAIEERRFADRIVPFDEEAYKSGVFNVPTYWIGGERYAEQPIQALRLALKEAMELVPA